MTGPDDKQIKLVTIVSNLKNATSYSWIVPAPSSLGYPSGKIYFLMFSESAKPDFGLSWSTRFTILEDDSASTVDYTKGQTWTIYPTAGGNSTTTTTDSSETTTTTTNTTETTTDSDSETSTSTTEASTTIQVLTTTAEPEPKPTKGTPTPQSTQNPFEDSGSNKLNMIGEWFILILTVTLSTVTYII